MILDKHDTYFKTGGATSRHFEDARSLLEHLESEHHAEEYLYRGQIGRYMHDWIDDSGPVKLEAIYPSDYRFITSYSNPDQLPFSNIPAARSRGRIIRDMFTTALMLMAEASQPAWSWLKSDLDQMVEHMAWLKAEIDSGRSLDEMSKKAEKDISYLSTNLNRLFWSLAQHYLIATALTDVTFSVRVAAWFATQRWSENDPPPTEGTGVIYRFKRPILEAVLNEQTAIMVEQAKNRGDARPPDLFFVDIRHIPKEFAGRPSGQEGGSVYGFDQPAVLKAIMDQGCLEIFEFEHSLVAESLKNLRVAIVPADDPFVEIADRIKHAIDQMFKVEVIAISSDGQLIDCESTEVLSNLKLVAGLGIDKARLVGRLPLGGEYRAYHFDDIKSSGHNRYSELLVTINEKTRAILGYISLEPVDHGADKLPFELFVMAAWFSNRRSVVDIGPNLAANGRFLERAIRLSREAIGKGTDSALASDLGRIVVQLGGPEGAKDVLSALFEAGDLDSGVNLGMLLLALGQADKGEAILKDAVDQGSADAAHNLGTVYTQRKNYREAELYFRRALEMGDKEANYSLGRMFESEGDWERAEKFYRESHDVDGDRRAPNNLAMALYNLGRLDEARQFLELGKKMGDELAAYNLSTMFPNEGS